MSLDRTCSKCKEVKPATREFFYWHISSNLFQSQCKVCMIEYGKKYQKDNPEKCQAKNLKWRKKNIPDWSAYCKEWRKNHQAASNAIQKKSRDKQKRAATILSR